MKVEKSGLEKGGAFSICSLPQHSQGLQICGDAALAKEMGKAGGIPNKFSIVFDCHNRSRDEVD